MNAFVKLREMLYNNTELRLEIEQIKIVLEKQNKKMNNQDKNIELVFQYLDELAEKKEQIPSERSPLPAAPIHLISLFKYFD